MAETEREFWLYLGAARRGGPETVGDLATSEVHRSRMSVPTEIHQMSSCWDVKRLGARNARECIEQLLDDKQTFGSFVRRRIRSA